MLIYVHRNGCDYSMKEEEILDNLVAICIPYYEKISLLKRLIASILNQTYQNYVVIVVDDGSDINAQKYIQ